MGYKYIYYLISLPLLIIIFKWGASLYYFNDIIFDLKFLLNFNDKQYFPYIISLSEINFSPSHNDYYVTDGVTSFPYASIIFHAFLFKFFDLSSIFIAELLFYTFAYLLVYFFLKKSGVNNLSSILATFLIFFSPIILEHANFFIKNINFENIKDLIFDYHLISLRFPRPLITDLYFYLSLILLLNFLKNNFNKKRDYILFGIILSLLLQSFIYLFLIIGFAYIIISLSNFLNYKNNFKEKFKYNLLLIIIFLLVTFPFILQNIYVEQDYVSRIGLFPINFESKKILLQQTIGHYISIKNFIYISIILVFYIFFKKKFSSKYLAAFKLYLLLVFSSFIVPIIFIVFSPYIVWFKHFFDVKNLIFIVGLILISAFIIESFFEKLIKKNLFILFYIFLVSGHLFYNISKVSNNYLINADYWDDLNKVIKNSDKILKKNKKNNVFSNSNLINNYYIYKKQNITYPDGFTNALNDSQMENLMINSYKSIGYSDSEFKTLLKNKVSWRSFNEIFQISHLKYQFNYLYTYFDIKDYSDSEIKFLKNKNLFLSESIALTKKEIYRLADKFTKYEIINEIKPNIVIIDKKEFDMKFTLSNDYIKIFDSEYFALITLK